MERRKYKKPDKKNLKLIKEFKDRQMHRDDIFARFAVCGHLALGCIGFIVTAFTYARTLGRISMALLAMGLIGFVAGYNIEQAVYPEESEP